MASSLGVTEDLEPRVRAFLDEQGVTLELVPAGSGDVELSQGERGQRADMTHLYAGGEIQCGTALALAPKLGLATRKMGAMLDHLGIRIRNCSLGCFE